MTPLVRTSAIALERFEHDPLVIHRDPPAEQASSHTVNFVESGSFRLRVRDTWQDVTSHHLFVTSPGLEFSCTHDVEHPDDCCLSIRYTENAVESLRGEGVLLTAPPVVDLTNRRAYLRWQLGQRAGDDATRAEAIAGALYWSLAEAAATRPLYRPHQLAWYAARVDRVKALIDSHFDAPLSLSQMADEAGMSVFHFARVFNELEGQTPHRRLLDVRLLQARRRLQEGASVTETCYGVGFGSLSHFISTYRRHFGERPSELRVSRSQQSR